MATIVAQSIAAGALTDFATWLGGARPRVLWAYRKRLLTAHMESLRSLSNAAVARIQAHQHNIGTVAAQIAEDKSLLELFRPFLDDEPTTDRAAAVSTIESAREPLQKWFAEHDLPDMQWETLSQGGRVIASSLSANRIGMILSADHLNALIKSLQDDAPQVVVHDMPSSEAGTHANAMTVFVSVQTPDASQRHVISLTSQSWYSQLNSCISGLQRPADTAIYLFDDAGATRLSTVDTSTVQTTNQSPRFQPWRFQDSGQNQTGYQRDSLSLMIGTWEHLSHLRATLLCEMPMYSAVPSPVFSWLIASAFYLPLLGLAVLIALPNRRSSLPPGKNQLGPYELVRTIATGGMGTVYLARHALLKRAAAVKVIRTDRLSPDDIARFDREVRLAAKMHSPHSVSIFDYGRTPDGQSYFAMEYLSGMTLDVLLARFGPLAPSRVVHIMKQVSLSLREAHDLGLVHRDVKPQNIMLTCRGGEPDFAVLLDFGLAKPQQPNDASLFMTVERIWAGTPLYMSPERLRNPQCADPASDIYALGMTAYVLLVGFPPFNASDPATLFEQVLSTQVSPPSQEAASAIPSSLDALVLRCLDKDPLNRPRDLNNLLHAIDQVQADLPWSRETSLLWWKTCGHGEENS